MNKQEIQEEIENTKCMIQRYQEQTQREKELLKIKQIKLTKLEKQLKECDKLKLVGGYISFIGGGYAESKDKKLIDNGHCYSTKELVDIAHENETTRNRLEAYSRVIDPDWREKWDEVSENYFIRSKTNGIYFFAIEEIKSLGTVYMSKKSVVRITQALNDGEIIL